MRKKCALLVQYIIYYVRSYKYTQYCEHFQQLLKMAETSGVTKLKLAYSWPLLKSHFMLFLRNLVSIQLNYKALKCFLHTHSLSLIFFRHGSLSHVLELDILFHGVDGHIRLVWYQGY